MPIDLHRCVQLMRAAASRSICIFGCKVMQNFNTLYLPHQLFFLFSMFFNIFVALCILFGTLSNTDSYS